MNEPSPSAVQIDKDAVRRAFDRAAKTYDSAAVLQREIGERMLERLSYVKLKPKSVLDAGSGTGYFTRQLAARYPGAETIGLDFAPGMIDVAEHAESVLNKLLHAFKRRRLRYVCGDVESIPLPDSSQTLVWSNLMLQWMNDPLPTLREFHRALEVEGLLMFSTFGPDTLKELRTAFAEAEGPGQGSPHVNRFIDMHDIGDMLVAAGFSTPVMDMEIITLTYADLRSLMLDLKQIGAHNVKGTRRRGLMGKGVWARLIEAYDRMRQEGKLPATYEVVYGHAWKPQPRVTDDGRAIIKTDFKGLKRQ